MTDQHPCLTDLQRRYPRLYMDWAEARDGEGHFNGWWFEATPQATLVASNLDAAIESLDKNIAMRGSPFWSA